jgi:hypothetical protein
VIGRIARFVMALAIGAGVLAFLFNPFRRRSP